MGGWLLEQQCSCLAVCALSHVHSTAAGSTGQGEGRPCGAAAH